ncbi:MAG TPA: ribonuclease P protein component [Vicinamibacterales bacterium]|nr:ribonuclease P protein component [Vicinamibacterales bacterium]
MTFRPRERIRRRADFEAIYEAGVKVGGRLMTVFVRKTDGAQARLGIAATRKIGGAVIRNRAKRLTRELFRSHKPTAALDIVVVPRREFLDVPYPSLEREFDALLERAARSPHARDGGDAAARRGRPGSARPDPRV